jgi:hypothetical protein
MRDVLKTQLLGALKHGLQDVERLKSIPEDAPQVSGIRHDLHKARSITPIERRRFR